MVNVFSGLVRCGDCEQNMVKRSTTKNGKKCYYYHCTTYKNTGDCSAHLISVDKLYEAVLAQVQLQIKKLIQADSLLKEVDALPNGNFKLQALQEQSVSLEKEIVRYTELKVKLYTDMSDKLISRDEYEELNKRFSQKIEAARRAQVEIEQQKGKLNLSYIHKQGWVEEFKQYGNIETLDRKTSIALIEKIIVYDKDTIEICFRYRDEMELLISVAEEYAKQTMGGYAV